MTQPRATVMLDSQLFQNLSRHVEFENANQSFGTETHTSEEEIETSSSNDSKSDNKQYNKSDFTLDEIYNEKARVLAVKMTNPEFVRSLNSIKYGHFMTNDYLVQ